MKKFEICQDYSGTVDVSRDPVQLALDLADYFNAWNDGNPPTSGKIFALLDALQPGETWSYMDVCVTLITEIFDGSAAEVIKTAARWAGTTQSDVREIIRGARKLCEIWTAIPAGNGREVTIYLQRGRMWCGRKAAGR